MPAVAAIPIIIDLVAPALATAIGEAILPSAIASTSIIGTSTTVASVVGGAIIGSGTAAVSAAITGQDIGKAAIGGEFGIECQQATLVIKAYFVTHSERMAFACDLEIVVTIKTHFDRTSEALRGHCSPDRDLT